jgi:hypothetical protein
LDDVLSLLGMIVQWVPAFVVAFGLGALIHSYYDHREQRKERARERFSERVLTRDFFSYWTLLWQLCDIYSEYDKVRKGVPQWVPIRGSLVKIHNTDQLDAELDKTLEQIHSVQKTLTEAGVFFFMPDRIRNRIADSGLTLKEIQVQLELGSDVLKYAEKLRSQLKEIQREGRGILDLVEL